MAYTSEAVELRQCRATSSNGAPCRAWAIWGHPDQPGSIHAAHLWQLFVLPAWWGRGVAPLLHDAAIGELNRAPWLGTASGSGTSANSACGGVAAETRARIA